MENQKLIISFGNYQTKILVGIKGRKEIVLYTNSFSSQKFIQNSQIVDQEKLVENLNLVFEDIKKKLGNLPTDVIYNVPLDNLYIREKKSNMYNINNQVLNDEYWNKIFAEVEIEGNKNKNYFCLEKKVTKWVVNNVTYHTIPYGQTGELFFITQLFLIGWKEIQTYLDLFDVLKFKNYKIVNDEMVMGAALEKNDFIEQSIVNIGDQKTTISLYYNHSLVRVNDYDFGIKKITSKISQLTGVDEETAISMLKNYNFYNQMAQDEAFNKLKIDANSLPFAMTSSDKFMEFKIFNLRDMNEAILQWMNELIDIINNFSLQLKKTALDIEELYIYTVTSIFKYWMNYLKGELKKKMVCRRIDTHSNSLHENKFIALIYCL